MWVPKESQIAFEKMKYDSLVIEPHKTVRIRTFLPTLRAAP
jgi:hypothetical protein